MDFWKEGQARYHILYCISGLTVFLLVIAGFGFFLSQQMKEMLFCQEKVFASSLLGQGVEEETIAEALNSRTETAEGKKLLQNMGHTADTNSRMFPFVWQTVQSITGRLLVICFLASVFFLAGTMYYLSKREALYQKAFGTIKAFAEGNFERHLSGNKTGTIYQLFAAVDELAASLQAKSENEHQAKEFLKNVISDISHQLKTPLAALHMYMEIIMEDAGKKDVVLDFAEKSTHSLERMEQLIGSLLKIVRLDAGSITFSKTENKVSELIQQSIIQLLERAKQEKKRLHLEGDEGEGICCDPEWTKEALGNLVKNALDHTAENGNIWITWKRSPAMMRVTVKDDGCGIAPEDIHHIFKRFYCSKHSSDRQGAGLGLPLAKAIIEGQGGILTVSSKPQEGASFSISFLTQV